MGSSRPASRGGIAWSLSLPQLRTLYTPNLPSYAKMAAKSEAVDASEEKDDSPQMTKEQNEEEARKLFRVGADSLPLKISPIV